MGRREGWAPVVVGDPAGSRPPLPGLKPSSPSLRDPPGSLGSDAPSPGRGLPWCEDLGPKTGDSDSGQTLLHFSPPRPSPLAGALGHRETDAEGASGLPPTNSCLLSPSPAASSSLWGENSSAQAPLHRALNRNILQRRRRRRKAA